MESEGFYFNEADSRFELNVENGHAIIDFTKKANTFNLIHTEVPLTERGNGLANDIVGKSLQYLKDNNFKVIPSCSFVSAYIARHPEWKSILA